MDPQWQSYPDAAGASRRHNGTASAQVPRDYAGQPPPPSYKYDQFHGGVPVPVHAANQPVSPSQLRDGNGDVPMHDAHDAHAGIKYPMRPHHQSRTSSGNRSALLHSPQEPSAAAQRYSPMETLSPTSPYAPKSAAAPGQFSPSQQRQSPTRQTDYSQQGNYFPASRSQAPQLPPITPYSSAGLDSYPSSAVSNIDGAFSLDPKSPRRAPPPMAVTRGPVPEFKKVRAPTDLRPKVNGQPPFRRANPEGGFISVRYPITITCLPWKLKVDRTPAAAPSSDCAPTCYVPHLQPQL